jgi:hypothetical protein
MDTDLELAQHTPKLGDTLDALIEAIANKLPDRPFSRLEGEVRLTLQPPEGMITCRLGSAEDMQWALGLFGEPTHGIPGHSVSWRYGNDNPPSISPLQRVLTSAVWEGVATILIENRQALAVAESKQAARKRRK